MHIIRRIFLAFAMLAAWPVMAGAAELKELVDQLGADDFDAKIEAVRALGALGDARAVVPTTLGLTIEIPSAGRNNINATRPRSGAALRTGAIHAVPREPSRKYAHARIR